MSRKVQTGLDTMEINAQQLGPDKALELMRLGKWALIAAPALAIFCFCSLKVYLDYFSAEEYSYFFDYVISYVPRFEANLIELANYFGDTIIKNLKIYYFSLIFVFSIFSPIYFLLGIYLAKKSTVKAKIDLSRIKNNPIKMYIVSFMLFFYIATTTTKTTSIIGHTYSNGAIVIIDTLFVSSILLIIFGCSLRYWTIRRFKWET